MILDTTTKSLQMKLSASSASASLPCVTSWADISTTTFVPGSNDTQTNNTTAVTIVAAPATITQRQVKTVTVFNADTAVATVTIMLNNNGTLRTIVSITLQVGQTLQFAENAWSVIDSTGGIQESGGSTGTAAGSNGQIQFNSGGTTLGGDPNLTWDAVNQTVSLAGASPSIQLNASTNDPVVPATGKLGIFGRVVSGRLLAAQIGPNGLSTSLQPLLARNKVGYWNPQGNSTVVPGVFGFTAPTVVGTATARSVSTTNLANRMRRIGYVSSATAGSLAENRVAVAQFSCGSGSNDGSGFFYVIRWVPSNGAAVAGERRFVGLANSTAAATNVEPSSMTNAIGVSQLSTDTTQLYLTYGGSTAQSPIGLGSLFPGGTLTTVAYELAIYAPTIPSNTFYYQVTNITTGDIASGTLVGNATQIPQNNTLLAPRIWASNNATALAVGFDICSIYIETDN